jgi:hypothetical protein
MGLLRSSWVPVTGGRVRNLALVVGVVALVGLVALVGCNAAPAVAPATSPPSTEAAASTPTAVTTATQATTATATASSVRAMLSRFVQAVKSWNAAAAPVVADLSSLGIDEMHRFGPMTAENRLELHAILSAMADAVDPAADPELASALEGLVASYSDKLAGVDGLAVALEREDFVAGEAAMGRWQRGIAGQRVAVLKVLEAARHHLTPAEISRWEDDLAR